MAARNLPPFGRVVSGHIADARFRMLSHQYRLAVGSLIEAGFTLREASGLVVYAISLNKAATHER